jgi:hypothetical protein
MSALDKPLSPLVQALVITGLGTILGLTGKDYFLRGIPIPADLVGWAFAAIGVLRLIVALLSRVRPKAEVEAARATPSTKARPRGARPRLACRKCGELVDADTLLDFHCETCRHVGEAAYR